MNQTPRLFRTSCLLLAFACSLAAPAAEPRHVKLLKATRHSDSASPVLWRDPGNTTHHGGKAIKPGGRFTFIKEDRQGGSPKFEVVDDRGNHWKAKLGEESKPETAAARLLRAAGYLTDEDYYLPEIHVEKMRKLHRGPQFVSPDGIVRGVRLELHRKGQKKTGNWSWFENPFSGTKELNGLRVMMALVNNWDLKESNNAIYTEEDAELQYVVSDLGATFGRTGDPFIRSKSNLRDYRRSKFIQRVTPEYVDFHMSSRPFFLTVFDLPNYITRTRMQGVAKHIPRTHAQWLGQLLGRLSSEQIRDCFRAAGYSPEEVEGFAAVVQARIADLRQL